ncbi:MAG: alpha/beta hydrolase-fold protein, partial [Pseudomonadota bacterium]
RDVYIWTPPGYDSAGEARYPVIYMHDGQHLFEPGAGVTGDEWMVDETMARLMAEDVITPAIVVGLGNTSERWQDYAPAAFIDNLPADQRQAIVSEAGGTPKSDAYLSFIVDEVKPMVDRTFRTRPNRNNTFVSGSSMGGLISLYAISEHPDVFGAAAALSTHWPLYNPETADTNAILAAVTAALEDGGLDPNVHRLWMDHGTENLDSYYAPYQQAMDSYFAGKGFGDGTYESQIYPGSDHNESSWATNLEDPLTFLLAASE